MRLFAALLSFTFFFLPFRQNLKEQSNNIDFSAVRAAVLLESVTNSILLEKEAEAEFAVSGVAKLPALLTLAQAFDEQAVEKEKHLRTSHYAASVTGPSAFLEEGESLSAETLFKAGAINTAGDAIMTLGEGLYGSEKIFCENVNATMSLCGATHSLTTALGHADKFSATDLAVLASAAVNSTMYTRWSCVRMDTITHADGRSTDLVSANRLLLGYGGCNGLITGSSAEDGYSGVFTAKRNGMQLIAVVIGAKNATERFNTAVAMLDYGFATYVCKTLHKSGEVIAFDIPVQTGKIKKVNVVTHDEVAVLLKKNESLPDEAISIPDCLDAPLFDDTKIGNITYSNPEKTIVAEASLYPEFSVERFTFRNAISLISADFLLQ